MPSRARGLFCHQRKIVWEVVMTPRRTKNLRMPPQPAEPLRVQKPAAAGIDVHAAEHWVAVPPDQAPPAPPDHPSNLPPYVRRFGACTADLEMLADWLAACGATTVAMESTGVCSIASGSSGCTATDSWLLPSDRKTKWFCCAATCGNGTCCGVMWASISSTCK